MYNRATKTLTEYRTRPDRNYQDFSKLTLYILANNKSFSAAEEFCYDLQALKRATIIGERTGGGAHGTFTQNVGYGFALSLPYSRAINPITQSNWEKTGVIPDIETSSDKALETAEILIFKALLSEAKNPSLEFELNWELELLKAINNPIDLDTTTLKSYSGVYGERLFTFENGKLYYQRTGRPKFELEAMTSTIMKGKGNTYFKVEFIKNQQGIIDEVRVYYRDNRVETSRRTD